MALADEMIKTIMKNLDCDEETAKDVIECDKRIDKGEKLFELSEEQKQASKKARSTTATKTPTVYTFKTKREKKADVDKGKLIADLLNGIPYAENVEIANPEREFTFTFNGKKYKVVLSVPRG